MAEPSPISRWKIPIVQDMSDGSGGSRVKERGVQRPSAYQPLASASLQRRWGPAPRGVTPPRVGEADHAPPASVGRGGAAIFGTVPGARLNTIKVRLGTGPPTSHRPLCRPVSSWATRRGGSRGQEEEEEVRGQHCLCPQLCSAAAGRRWGDLSYHGSAFIFSVLIMLSLYKFAIYNSTNYFISFYICFDGKIRELCIFRAHLILSSPL